MLGSYVRHLSFKKEDNMQHKDVVVNIITEWYDEMYKNNLQVPPKASTILGTILAKHFKDDMDAYERYMNTPAKDFADFWKALSPSEKEYVESMRDIAREQFYADRELVDHRKELLKG